MLIFRDPSEKVACSRYTFHDIYYLTHGSSEIPQKVDIIYCLTHGISEIPPKDGIIIIKFTANPFVILYN